MMLSPFAISIAALRPASSAPPVPIELTDTIATEDGLSIIMTEDGLTYLAQE